LDGHAFLAFQDRESQKKAGEVRAFSLPQTELSAAANQREIEMVACEPNTELKTWNVSIPIHSELVKNILSAVGEALSGWSSRLGEMKASPCKGV
jgi:hypothetical protein